MIFILLINLFFTTYELNVEAINVNYSQIIEDNEFDFIIIGGGAAGSVIAGRLSEDPSVKVLIVEAGGSDKLLSDTPALYPYLLGSELDWDYRTEPQKNCCINIQETRVRWARGKVLGGSSQINAMLYLRGVPKDFDNWANIGCKGWSYNDVLPYFKKAEKNYNKQFLANGLHGDSGPLPVTDALNFPDPSSKNFIDAAKEIGFKVIDLNGPNGTIGVNMAQKCILKGSRVSAAKAYLEPVSDHRPNLYIWTKSFVTRVIVNNNTAQSVEFYSNCRIHNIKANKEIILSAGAINTPQILLLSGIGPKEHLKNMHIPVVADVPGVGENLQDHAYVMGPSFTVNTLSPSLFTEKSVAQYLYNKSGPLSYLNVPKLFMNSTVNRDNDWPDIQLSFDQSLNNYGYFNGVPHHHYGIKSSVYQKYFAPYEGQHSIMHVALIGRPKSRGYLRLKSIDPFQYPILEPNYLTHPDDVQILIDGLKMLYKIGQSNTYKQHNVKLFTTLVPGCEHHYSNKDLQQLKSGIIMIPSNEYLKCVVRHMTYAGLHMVGTCKMGPESDPMSVVDLKLKVKNVRRLRVIDASIMPEVTNGNTYAPTIMIGERGAQFIKDEYNLL